MNVETYFVAGDWSYWEEKKKKTAVDHTHCIAREFKTGERGITSFER